MEAERIQQQLQNLSALPVEEAYTQRLASMRFDYMSMKLGVKADKKYDHYFDTSVKQCATPAQSKIVRLAQEIADLSNSLPCYATNAMYCRVDKERVDLMKVLIMGAQGTPYAHGAFVYDLFFPNDYPSSPPKCQLVTTGGEQVRFNPNLYSNGKVCLSLLGTWRGSSTEMWDPKLSTILQLLLSIQAIIMSSEVYFNEPGYEYEMNTPEGAMKNTAYSNIVRYCNIKFAMIEAIRNPPNGFEQVLRASFWLKKEMILEEVRQWVEEAADAKANYSGLVCDHNCEWANKFSKKDAYKEAMVEIYAELEKALNELANPFDGTTQASVR